MLYLSQIRNSLLGSADSSVTHSPLTFLRLRAVNDSSFELLYRSLQVTVRSFKATDLLLCHFLLVSISGANNVRALFRITFS